MDALFAQGFTHLKSANGQALPDAPFAEGAFPSPSGKCEFFSQRLADMGQDGLPDYIANYEIPQTNAEFPLAMISPPARNFLNSSFVNLQSLRDIETEPVLEMHPKTHKCVAFKRVMSFAYLTNAALTTAKHDSITAHGRVW
jgi:anaerobic selenocysteine-containing dehydrogenase